MVDSNKKYKIALIDDKNYWIDQIKNSIPEWIKYDFFYFDSYKKALWKSFDIILLDYYLDIDWVNWEDIVDKLKAKKIIWFSSVLSCSKKIAKKWWDYFVEKLKFWRNLELEEIFMLIFFDE